MADDYSGFEVVAEADPYAGFDVVSESTKKPKDNRIKIGFVPQDKSLEDQWKKAKPGDTVQVASSGSPGESFEATKLDDEHASKVERVINLPLSKSREDVSEVYGKGDASSGGFDTQKVLAKAGLSAPASAAFLTTMGATSRATQGLQASPNPLVKAAGIVAPIAAGAVAAGAESFLQRKLTEVVAPGVNRFEESMTPGENVVGAALGSGFRPGAEVGGARQQILSRLVPAGAGAGIQTGVEAVGGFQEGALSRIGESALTNALLNKATGPAQALINTGGRAAQSLVTKVDSIKAGGNVNAKSTTINNEIALDKGTPLNEEYTPTYENVGIPENLEGYPSPQPKHTILEDLPMMGKDITRAAKTKNPTPIQKQIEEAVGLGKARRADELDVEYNARIREEAAIRSQIEAADEAARKVMDLAGDKGPTPVEALVHGEKKPSISEMLQLRKTLSGEVDTQAQFETQKAYNDRVAAIMQDLKDNGAKPSRSDAVDLANTKDPVEFSRKRDALIVKDPALTKVSPLKVKDILELPSSTFNAPSAEPPSPGQLNRQGEIASERPRTGGMVQSNAAPAIGAVIGYQFGETPEERRKNAVLGALIGAGGVVAKNLVQTLAKTNKPFLDQINKAAVEARAKGETTWDNYLTGIKDTPVTEIGSLERNLTTPAPELTEAQDAPISLANASPRYQWTPFLSKIPVFGPVIKKAIGTTEGNIRPISQPMFGMLRQFDGFQNELEVTFTKETHPFGVALRKAFTPQEVKELNAEILFGSHAKAREIIATKGDELAALFDKAKQGYEGMAVASEAVGRTINRIDDAWPRQMVDFKKFREFITQREIDATEADLGRKLTEREKSKIRKFSPYDAAVKAAEQAKGKPLSEQEKADVLNDAISLTLKGKPSFLKPRSVEGLTADQVWEFYEPFDVSMDNRVTAVARDVAKRKYLGHESPEDTDLWDAESGDFGTLLQQEIEAGNISDEGQEVIVQNLKDMFKTGAKGNEVLVKMGNWVSRANNTLFLGDISTSLSQFNDIFNIAEQYGLLATAKGYGSTIGSRVLNKLGVSNDITNIKMEELGLGKSTFVEMQGLSHGPANKGIRGVANRSQRKLLDMMVGWADGFNKDAAINSARAKFAQAVRDPHSRDYVRLYKKYSESFPKEWPEILKDLRSKEFAEGKLTKHTRLFLFNELADFQPLSMSQRAQLESAAPGVRFAYSLHRYWIKQLDRLRQNGYEKIKIPGQRAEGMLALTRYTLLVAALGGMATSTLRDVIFGREVDLTENALGGAFQMVGLNKYMIEDLRGGHIGDAALSFTLPLGSVAKDAYKDYATAVSGDADLSEVLPVPGLGQQSRLLKYFPVVGREAYQYSDLGEAQKLKAEKRSQKEQASSDLSPTLSSLEKLFLPPPPKKK